MQKQFSRIVCLALQAILVVAYTVLVVGTSINLPQVSKDFLLKVIPTEVCLLMGMVSAFFFFRFTRSTVGTDTQLIPILHLAITVTSIRTMPYFVTLIPNIPVNLQMVATFYQISVLFSSLLIIQFLMFQTEINNMKIFQLMLIFLACSIFFGLFVPVTTGSEDFLNMAYITSIYLRLFMHLVCFLGIIAMCFAILHENLSKETILKVMGTLLILFANTFHTVPYSPIIEVISALLMSLGFVLLIIVAKSNRIWA